MTATHRTLEQMGIESNWTFLASAVPLWRRRKVAEALLRRSIRFPAYQCIKPIKAREKWALYFIFSPDGMLTASHLFALKQLRDLELGILAVIASSAPRHIPDELDRYADAIYWKEFPGYDFSAYKLGLDQLSTHSPGCSVLVMNDSVIGPLTETGVTGTLSWELTGFTASGSIENHIQSYAFRVNCVTPTLMRQLWPVFFPLIACRDRDDVIECQETRFGRVAAHTMSVGAYWYMAESDATQKAPFELIEAGLPFIKRSLLDPRSAYADKDRVRAFIDQVLNA